jgi:hypothetical protein
MDGGYRNLANTLVLCLIHGWGARLLENGAKRAIFHTKKETFHQKAVELRLKCTERKQYFTEQ